jgi:hypothetical protein
MKKTPKKDVDKIIRLKPKTHIRLKDLGGKGESFDDVINKLIDNYEKMLLGGK